LRSKVSVTPHPVGKDTALVGGVTDSFG